MGPINSPLSRAGTLALETRGKLALETGGVDRADVVHLRLAA
jgi:hypothetical protein